mgnify:CR=1 FL=1
MRILLRVTAYGLRRKRLALITGIAFAVASIPPLAAPKLAGLAIDEALSSGSHGRLLTLAGIIAAVSLLRAALGYASMYLAEATSQRVAYDLRKDFFDQLQNLSQGFHDKQLTGNLMSKATVDVDAIRMYVAFGFLAGFGSLTVFTTAVVIMILTNWVLGLVSFVFLPVIIWPSAWMATRMTPLYEKAHAETGNMNAAVQENLSGMRVVKAFGAREYETAKFGRKAFSVLTHFNDAGKVLVTGQSTISLAFAAVTAAILLIGGTEVFADRMTPGELASFILYMGVLIRPINILGWRFQIFSRAIAAGRRIFEVLDAESPVKDTPSAKSLHGVKGKLEFDHVSLSYRRDTDALHDVHFEVMPGQTVAILGGPGSGKSTIVNLLPRFYDATAGRILIDEVDIREVSLESLRQNIGIVLQDVFIFSASIRENIAYGVNNASMPEVINAAKVAHLHDFIENLPDGYETWVGERGVTLSGGQRQRLAIARTVLTDPPILVIDDATSSVDVGTEALIQRAMAKVVEGRTTLIIAHRLSAVRDADLILVLDEGKLIESGSHEELMVDSGYYRSIYESQLMPQEEAHLFNQDSAERGAVDEQFA